VREFGVITLEQAVYQLTHKPAQLMGLRERGLIRPGWHADITIFDPATVACGPAYTRFDLPAQAGRLYADAIGISCVLVNGTVIIRDGVHTGAVPGTLLRCGRDTRTVPIPAAS
jgi:N-acyl-D-aspartate/D-glutamate deacylase